MAGSAIGDRHITVYYIIVSQFQISDNNKHFIIHPAMQCL